MAAKPYVPVPWIVLAPLGISKVLSTFVQKSSNENIGADVQPGDPYTDGMDDRKGELLWATIERFRGAIRVGSRTPLSQTAYSIPPELELHVLNVVAYQFVNSQPNLQMFVMAEGGVYAPIAKMHVDALKVLDDLSKGNLAVSYPADPETNEDGVVVPNSSNSDEITADGPSMEVDY